MNFVKRWFGWGGQESTSASEDEYEHQKDRQQRQPAGRQQRRRTGESPPPPVLADAPHGDGGIQGLDWFRRSMLRDSDGDCAHTFLEEEEEEEEGVEQPCGVPPRQRAQAGRHAAAVAANGSMQQGTQKQCGSRGASNASQKQQQQQPEQQRGAALQCKSRRAKQVGPSDMLLEGGNVYVVPHSDDP